VNFKKDPPPAYESMYEEQSIVSHTDSMGEGSIIPAITLSDCPILDNSEDNDNSNFKYNNHNECIFDDARLFPSLSGGVDNDTIVAFDADDSSLINHGSIIALIVQLTSPDIIDYNLICDFFLTYRSFVEPQQLLDLLLTRLIWSLQYCNGTTAKNVTLGKLVLLRTFVVLRHWLINYFFDDFVGNSVLCDKFVTNMNELIESELVQKSPETAQSPDNNLSGSFESKILSNLKIHWLSLINDFSGLNVDIDMLIDSNQLLNYKIPLMAQIPSAGKQQDLSLHTNPSYRRSAMLSLYDSQIHKCLIYDDNSSTENPQYSINNLVLQHQSSRISLQNKLNEFKSSPKILASSKFSPFTNMNVTTKSNQGRTRSETHPMHNHMNLKDNSWQIKNKSVPSPNSPYLEASPNRLTKTGFSTNGNIKLPSSKVSVILPSTPVKKMEDYGINCNSNSKTTGSPNDKNHELSNRKKSVKKLMHSWKKPNNKEPLSAEQTPPLPKSTSDNSIVSENEKFTRLLTNTVQIMDEDHSAKIGNRVDILSARIIDELEYLIGQYIKSSSPSTIAETENLNYTCTMDGVDDLDDDLGDGNAIVDELPQSLSEDSRGTRMSTEFGSPRRKPRHTSQTYKDIYNDKVASEDININDLSDLNIGKIDNLINKEDRSLSSPEKKQILPDNLFSDSSFQRPTSINWNDDVDLNESSPPNSNDVSQNTYDVEEHDFNFKQNNSSGDLDSMISNEKFYEVDPGDDKENNVRHKVSTQYFDVSTDQREFIPPFNESNQSLRSSSISSPSNITQYDAEIAELGIALSPRSLKKQTKRISIARNSAISFKRQGSMKSYMSYDSAFSVSNISGVSNNINGNDTGLRKKAGFNNLRTLMNNPKSADLGSDVKMTSMASFVSRSSSIHRSIRFSTLCALVELPFNEVDDKPRSTNLSEILDSSIFSVAVKSRKSSMRKSMENCMRSSASSSNSVAIPGISNYILKELAAIPDESYQSINDPVQFALFKLEGKESKSTINAADANNLAETLIKDVKEGQNDSKYVDDTQAILNEINNANTEDCVSVSNLDMTQEPPLTPVRKTTQSVSASTPNFKGLDFKSPKVILDNYRISNELLTIEKVMKQDSHISFMLSYKSKTIADHLTMIEKDMLQEIDWKELIELKWNKDLTPMNSWLEIIVNDNYFVENRGVNLVIARFNLMVNWIISEILLTKHQRERIVIISRFIHVAQNCYSLQNYSTLMQVILALTSEKVQKLKETWKNLAPGDILMLKNLEELASPFKNFLNMRICINKMKPSKGCIPFVGLYLSDLVFNAERPTFVKPKMNKTKPTNGSTPEITEVSITSSIPSGGSEKTINFSKFRTAVHIVKSLSQCIEWSNNYKVEPHAELLSKCLYVKSLDEEEMNYCINSVIDG
jgi:GDP/GTP exchange factor required for growth at low temperature